MFVTAELLEVPLKLGPVASKFTMLFPLEVVPIGDDSGGTREGPLQTGGGAIGTGGTACPEIGAMSSPAVTAVAAPAKRGQRFVWVIDRPPNVSAFA